MEKKDFLRGPVPSDTKKGVFANYIGLKTIDNVKKWQASPEFAPFYDQLYDKAIEPRQRAFPGKQGPLLSMVQAAFANGEAYGDERYTKDDPPFDEYEEIDWYAYTLYKLRKKNVNARNGIFHGKHMPTEDMDYRLWHAILLTTADKTRKRAGDKRKALKKTAAESLLNASKFLYADNAEKAKQDALETLIAQGASDKPSPKKKPKTTHPSFRFLSKSAAPGNNSANSGGKNSASGGADSAADSAASGADADPNTTSGEASTSRQDTVIELSDSSEDDLSVATSAASPAEPPITKQQRLESTMDEKDPLSLHTDYGRYATINAVLEKYKNVFDLMKFVDGPEGQATDEADLAVERQHGSQRLTLWRKTRNILHCLN